MYEADISPVWCVGSVAHGGVLVNVLVDAVLKRQARYSSAHRDPAHLSAQFLTATVPGKATVEVKVVSESKRWTRLDVELYQWTPDVHTTYYLDPKTQRTLRIRAHVLVTTLPDHPPLHAGSAVSAPVDMNNFLSRPCPLLVHPSQVDMSDGGTHVPEKLMFRDGMRWKDVEVTNSDQSLASGSWIELTGGEDVSLSAGKCRLSFRCICKQLTIELGPFSQCSWLSLRISPRTGPRCCRLTCDPRSRKPADSSRIVSQPGTDSLPLRPPRQLVPDHVLRARLQVQIPSEPSPLARRLLDRSSARAPNVRHLLDDQDDPRRSTRPHGGGVGCGWGAGRRAAARGGEG